jgi:hypothetical protein
METKHRRKSFGVRLIGKPFQCDNDQFAVVKTKMGYYPRIRGTRYFKIGNRYKTEKGARRELIKECEARKVKL